MNTYYVFPQEKIALAEQLIQQVQGEGFFDFKVHEKITRVTSLPLSNTQQETIRDVRPVLVLETDFAEADANLRKAAEAQAEFFSSDATAVRVYLETAEA